MKPGGNSDADRKVENKDTKNSISE